MEEGREGGRERVKTRERGNEGWELVEGAIAGWDGRVQMVTIELVHLS